MKFLVAFSAVCLFAGSQAVPAEVTGVYESQVGTLKLNVERAVEETEYLRAELGNDAEGKISNIEDDHKTKIDEFHKLFGNLISFFLTIGNEKCVQQVKENYKKLDDATAANFRKCYYAGLRPIEDVQGEYSKVLSFGVDGKKRVDVISKNCGSPTSDKAKACYDKELSNGGEFFRELTEKLRQVKEDLARPVYEKMQVDVDSCYTTVVKEHAFLSLNLVKSAEQCQA